jgi:alkaline phosphatase
MESLLKTKGSFDTVMPKLRANATAAGVKDVLKASYGVEVTDAEAEAVVASINGEHSMKLSQFFRSANMTLASVLGNYNKVVFTCLNHTSDHVLVTAVGPGSEQCGGLTENTAFFDMILAARGMTWENPKMTYEEALRHIGKMQARVRAERGLYAVADEIEGHAFGV